MKHSVPTRLSSDLIRRVVVSTYQSVSGAGQEGMDELFNQTKGIFQLQEAKPKIMPHRIAFNVIPQIDVLMPDGSFKEEWKMVEETKKILDPSIQVIATCVRVPVFVGHRSEEHTSELQSLMRISYAV